MAVNFNCPNCGATISYEGSETSIACPYCGGPAVAPVGGSVKQNWNAMSPSVKIILIVIVLAIVVPTCLGWWVHCWGARWAFVLPCLQRYYHS